MEYGYSDEPVDASGDELGRVEYAKRVAHAIDLYRNRDTSAVSALVGPWGAGKSSIVRMMTSELESGGDWTVQLFNPWFYPDESSMQAGFLRLIENTFNLVGLKAKRVRRAIGDVAQSIAPAGGAVPFAGPLAEAALTTAGDLLSKAPTADRAIAELERLLRSGRRSRTVLIVMDDLDRLAPAELLLVFKFVRLVGRLPYVHYLLAYDEDTLLDVLSRTGLVGERDPRRGTDFIEKMVQIRFEVPPLRDRQVLQLVNSALSRLATSSGLALTDSDMSRFSAFYFEILRSLLRTPRSIKRYIAQCEAMWQQLKDEVDPVDYLILTWLRTS
jgi:predicted KAP-like P-loop ATPase